MRNALAGVSYFSAADRNQTVDTFFAQGLGVGVDFTQRAFTSELRGNAIDAIGFQTHLHFQALS